mgnify:CR=1 FL=1
MDGNVTDSSNYPEQLLSQTAWLQRLSRELVPSAQSADLVQETLVAALERAKPSKAGVRTWLERIARNLAAGGTRAHHRRVSRERHAPRSDDEPATVDTIAQFEMHRSVVDAVEALRDPIRTTMLLRFWEDLPPREIAKRMQAPVETVRTRIKRGLQELRGSLDAQHGRREAWSVPLVSFAAGRRAVVAPASLAASTAVVIMSMKILAIGAIVAVAVLGAFAWQASQPDVPSPNTPEAVATPGLETAAEGKVANSDNRAINSTKIAPDLRTSVGSATSASTEWFVGTITDEQSRPLADVEVSLMTSTEADQFRKQDEEKRTAKALEIAQARWSLWHLSDRGWMKKKVLLGDMFGVELVTRTAADGSFRIRRDGVPETAVLVVWSPDVGCRFRPVTLSSTHQNIVCETWPRISGQVTSGNEQLTEPASLWIDYESPSDGRVLQFFTDATGHYETPQIPWGMHSVEFRAKDHHHQEQSFDLRKDQTLDAKMVPLDRFRAKLIDEAGRFWERQRLAGLGWDVDKMQFLLLRDDLQNETELARYLHTKTALRFDPDDGWLQGAVADSAALVLSVWQGREHIASVQLPDHRVDQVAMTFAAPLPATTLEVAVSLGVSAKPDTVVHLTLGTMVGIGSYNFEPAVATDGARERFRLELPGFLRDQVAQLRVSAEGFATRLIAVPIPKEGTPKPVEITMAVADLTLLGRVIDENNQPVAKARVRIATADGSIFRSGRESFRVTDEAGGFRYEGLEDRDVRVFVAREGFAATSELTRVRRDEPMTVRLLPGVLREIDTRAAGNGVFMLRVLDSQGAPLRDDRLYGGAHGGATIRLHVSIHSHTVELWKPGASKPTLMLPLQ